MNRSRIKLVIAVLVLGTFAYSCEDFLTPSSQGALAEDVLADRKGAETLLLGTYAALQASGSGGWGDAIAGGAAWEACPSNWIYGSVVGGDAHKGSEAGDQVPINSIASLQAGPTIGFFDSKWKAQYEGISRANSVLSLLPDVEDMTEDEKSRVAAEARFLRGHYYFELKKMFNNVPWIDEETSDFRQPNNQDIWSNIEADFEYAYQNLPETQPNVGRANKWAAASYLARAYVYQEKWSDADNLYDTIIANGQTSNGLAYELVPRFFDAFNPVTKNHSEDVFSVQSVAVDGTSGSVNNSNAGMKLNYPFGGPTNCCGFYQPTQELVNSYRTDSSTGLPLPDTYNSTMVTNDMGLTSSEQFTPYSGTLDPRLDWTVGRRGVPYHDWGPHPGMDWIRDQAYSGPYSAQKHLWFRKDDEAVHNRNSWAPGSAYNIPIIRFADVLLMAAEAAIETGDLEKARGYVNRVRARAANQDGWVSNELNKEYALAVVNSEAEMLATDASPGDWVVREDENATYVLLSGSAGDINNWNKYEEPNYSIATYDSPWSGAEEAREAVRFERKLELAMEGQRFFDLVRWGIAEEELNKFFEYESTNVTPSSYLRQGQFTSGRNEYFPIPQRQIDLSSVDGEPTLTQNPGYN